MTMDEKIKNMLSGCAYDDTHGVTEGIKELLESAKAEARREVAEEIFKALEGIMNALDAQVGNREMNLQDCDMVEKAHKEYKELQQKYLGEKE